MKKKLVFLLLACLMLCAAVTSAMAVEHTFENVVYYWDYGTDDYALVYSYKGTPIDITIESIIEGRPVTSIYEEAFKDCATLQSITLPNSITRIDSFAFENCTNLQSIMIPNSVTDISGHVFANCDSLQGVTIPKSVTNFHLDAFRECTNLKEIIFEGMQPPAIWDKNYTYLREIKTISVPFGSKTAYQNAVGAGNADKVVEYMPVVQESPFDGFNIRLITTEIPADEYKPLEVGAKQKAAEVFGIPASAVGMELKDWKLQAQYADEEDDGEWFKIGGDDFPIEEITGGRDIPISLSVALPAAAKGKNVAVIHRVNGAWKVEDSSVADGKITVSMNSLSPVAIVWAEDVAIDLPKTGDDSNVILWSALACISVIGMMTLVRKRKEA